MAMLHGKGGSVTSTTTFIPLTITSWSVSATCDTADSTTMNSANDWKEYLAGFKSWTATVETNYDGTSTFMDGLGVSVALKMFLAGTTNLGGNGICTGVSTSTDANDVIKVSYTFQGTGALAYAAS